MRHPFRRLWRHPSRAGRFLPSVTVRAFRCAHSPQTPRKAHCAFREKCVFATLEGWASVRTPSPTPPPHWGSPKKTAGFFWGFYKGEGECVGFPSPPPFYQRGVHLGSPLRGSCRALARLRGCHSNHATPLPSPVATPTPQGVGKSPPHPLPPSHGGSSRLHQLNEEGAKDLTSGEKSVIIPLSPPPFSDHGHTMSASEGQNK